MRLATFAAAVLFELAAFDPVGAQTIMDASTIPEAD